MKLPRELEHSGVKGMKWRKGRKTPFDASNTNLQRKTANGNARVEASKDISLQGKANKKFQTTEKKTDQQSAREELNSKIREAEADEKLKRQQLAKAALKTSIKKAKKKAEEKAPEPKKETKKTTTSNYIQRRHVSRYKY